MLNSSYFHLLHVHTPIAELVRRFILIFHRARVLQRFNESIQPTKVSNAFRKLEYTFWASSSLVLCFFFPAHLKTIPGLKPLFYHQGPFIVILTS